MALVKCDDCGKEVSDRAPACPSCGAPIAGAEESKAAGAHLTTVQQTSKRLKAHSVIAGIMMIVGLIWMVVGINSVSRGGDGISGLSILLAVVGVVWLVVTRIRIWWHHD